MGSRKRLRLNPPLNLIVNWFPTIKTLNDFNIHMSLQFISIFPYHLWIWHEDLREVKVTTNFPDINPKRDNFLLFIHVHFKVFHFLETLRLFNIHAKVPHNIKIVINLYKIYIKISHRKRKHLHYLWF